MYGVTPPTMMKQIALLEKAALIERAAAANSKHVLQVELTPQGKRALQEADARALAVEEEIFSAPTPAELAQYRGIMLKLLRRLTRTDHEVDAEPFTRAEDRLD